MSRRGRDPDLGVEELDVGAWGGPGPDSDHPVVDPPPGAGPPIHHLGPPEQPGSARHGHATEEPAHQGVRSWWQRHSNHAIAGAGAFALLVAVVAVASGPGGDPAAAPTSAPTTVAPSTTEGRPVETLAPSTTSAPQQQSGSNGDTAGTTGDDVDYRFALPIPEGFEVTGADVSEPLEGWLTPAAPALFAADGSAWQTGPWLTIASGNERTTGFATMFPLTRPATPYAIGDAEARTGPSIDGVEVTTLRQGATVVEIGARGLDPLATASVAQAIQITDDGIAVPDAAIPVGLSLRPDIDVTTWSYGGWSPDQRASVSFLGPDQNAWIGFAALPAGRAADLMAGAPFFLGDLRYLVVGTGTGVAGSFAAGGPEPTRYVVWRLADRDYVATATGVGLDELVSYAASVVQPGDPEWRTSLWDDLRDDARDCCQQQPPFVPYRPVEVPVGSADGFEWRAEAAVQPGSVSWNLTLSGPTGDGLDMQSPLGAPVLRVGSRYGWAGQATDFPAAAVAIVDRTMSGAVLRLSTTGSQPQTVDVPLQAVDDDVLQPYLVGAAVLPWFDGGFVAQLIAPDGQTIAVQTDADLP